MYNVIVVKFNNKRYYISCNENSCDELADKISGVKTIEEFGNIIGTLFQYDADLVDGKTIEMYVG